MAATLNVNIDHHRLCSAELPNMLLEISLARFVATKIDEEVAVWPRSVIAKAQNLRAKRFPPWLHM